jgi:hypothetical protein
MVEEAKLNKATGELKTVVKHLKANGVLTPSDTKAIVHALELLQVDSSPQTQKSLSESDPYWEARNKALHDRKYHP